MSVPREILELAAKVAEYVSHRPIDYEQDIPAWLLDAGFTRVSHGVDRGAVIGDKWVIKYPRSKEGFNGLECEFDIFMGYLGQEEIKYLPYTELVRQGRAMAMVQEAVTIDSKIFEKNRKEVEAVIARFNMRDGHEGNIGFRRVGGRWHPVVIDLGEFAVPLGRAHGQNREEAPSPLNKFAPSEADSAFAEGVRRLGMDPSKFAKATHRKLG